VNQNPEVVLFQVDRPSVDPRTPEQKAETIGVDRL
jgi:hypothetical protein